MNESKLDDDTQKYILPLKAAYATSTKRNHQGDVDSKRHLDRPSK